MRKPNVVVATAEIYTIDGYCPGAPLAFKDLATKLKLSAEDTDVIILELQKENVTLQMAYDALKNNKIRLVLAGLIPGEP